MDQNRLSHHNSRLLPERYTVPDNMVKDTVTTGAITASNTAESSPLQAYKYDTLPASSFTLTIIQPNCSSLPLSLAALAFVVFLPTSPVQQSEPMSP